jgi:hypothetical protein
VCSSDLKNLGNGGQGKWEIKKYNQWVYGGTENAIRKLESEKLNCLNGNTVKLKRRFWNTKGRRLAQKNRLKEVKRAL